LGENTSIAITMPTLILRLDERQLRECAIGTQPLTIGRLRDNRIVIDHPAVSGRHARVYREGVYCVLEDLGSTNGTFVNDKPIARHTLIEGDVILVGKHTLSFTQKDVDAALQPDAEQPAAIYEAVVPKTAVPTAPGRIGTVKVIGGHTTQPQFVLTAMATMIGKADHAQIPLRGWFKPQAAAAIMRTADGFTITPLDGTLTVNGETIFERRDLANGDLVEVSGLTFEFELA
jgi:FHA domain